MEQSTEKRRPWMAIARSYVGLKEIEGKLHNPSIIRMLKDFALNIGRWGKSRDETPWCAVFVSHCLDKAGYESTKDARAVKYATYGTPSNVARGSIIVIQRKRKDGENTTGSNRGGYHVGFLVKATKNWYHILGGNQRDSVNVTAYSKARYRLVALRWPIAKGSREPTRSGPRKPT